MTALSAEAENTMRDGNSNAWRVANSTTIYSGGLTAIATTGNATSANIGKAVPMANAVALAFVGVADRVKDSNTSTTGSSDVRNNVATWLNPVIVSDLTIANTSATSVGSLVYASTDNPSDLSLTPSSNHNVPVGIIVKHIVSTSVDVLLFGIEGMAALYSSTGMGNFTVPGQLNYTGTSAREFVTNYPVPGAGKLRKVNAIYQGASTLGGSGVRFVIDRGASAVASLVTSGGHPTGTVLSTTTILADNKFDRGDTLTVRVASAQASTTNGDFAFNLEFDPVFGA